MKKVDNSRLKFVMLALFFLGTFLYAFNTIIQPEIERASNGTGTRESAFEWGRVRLDGKRIGCYTADASANPRTKYTAIVSMLVARGAIVTDITDAMMPVSASLLANYNIVWFDEGSGNILEPTELTSIDTWVQGGGSVLCTGDDSSSPSDEVSSKLGPYWTSFYTGTGTTTNVYGHQITQGVTSLYYSDYTWMPTADLYATLVAEVGSTEIAAAMTKGSGKAVFICDDNIFLNYTQADNYLFANNTFGWLGFKNQNAPQLTAGQVSPGNGAQNVLFSFLVTYSDSDNNEPLYVNVTVDGMVHAMSKLVPTDYNFTDGSTYSFSRYLQPGSHVFSYTCGDGTYTNTTTNINGPTVSTTNSAPPTLTNTQLNRLKGNNTTIFNFSATYTDTDNNFPSIITVSLNSTSYVLTPTNTYDFNAMDGKNYCHANTISPFGIYFYRFNCSDGLNTVSTGWYPGPEVHPYYYIGGPIEKVAIFRDQLPWGRSENELVFTANGISYDVFTSSSLGKVPLHPYNKVLIPSQQPTSFYNVLVQPNVRVWIELYVQSGGIFEMHYNHYSSDDILGTLPGGYTEVENIQDYITINPAFLSHPLITSVTQSAMNSWGDLSVDTSTSYLTGMAGTEQILMYDSLSRPRYIIRNQGTGLFIYAGLIIEYSAYYDQGPADALLQKVLLYTQNAERYWYPTLVSPANGTAMFTGTQTFKWASLAHPLVTTRYTWQLSSDSGFSSIVGQNTSILETAGNTSITIPISYPTGRYYWRVRPYYNTMVGGWSEVRFIDITYNNNAPTLTSPKVNPTSGNQDTSFTFTVVYTDSDNNAPTTMQMAINSTIYAMQKQNAGDNTYTDGCTYQFSSYLPSGIIAYYFTANDGKYSVTSSTFTNLTVGYTNVNSPVLSSPSISPMLGNNRTYVVFNITYTDADNNMPALIYAYVNGSGIALTPVQASDLNVMDGKLYTASSRLGFGKYQVLFNCSDGTRIASTAVLPGPEINPFLPVFTYDRVAIFQDQYPWGFSEIIPIVNAHSISYSIYSSASFLKVSLATFDKVIISSNQPLAFYTSLQTASVKSWFESYVASGGILEFHAASVSIALSNLPGGYNAPYQTVNSLSINASYSSHPILTGVTDTGIDNWGSSGHTYFTGFSGGEKVLIYDASSQPRMFLKNFSQGLFIYNGMPVEYAAYYNHGDGDALLTNMVLYSESLNRTALLLEPSQGSSLWNGIISFKWTRLTLDVPFVNYTWQIAATRDFSSPLSEVPTIQEVAVNTTTTQSVNYATGYYYWRVRPSYRGLLGQWSEPAWINLTRNDFAPVLSNGIYNPPTGNQLTTFNFSVIYTDADNNTPQYIRINIDGTSHGMLKAKPTDKDYTNGCSFYYLTTLSAGNHNFNYSTFDGIYPATIATQIITVAVINDFTPTLTSPAFTPSIGDNGTLFNFTVTYTDADNNFPASIIVTANGITMPMIEVKPTDTIVSDGKFYCVNFTLPSFGSSTFYINASDGLHLASTAVIAGPQVHPFYGYGQLGQVQRVALFKNSNPFGGTPEETILTAKGISYTVYTASSFGVSLNGFDKVIIAGDQPYSFYSSSYFSSSSTRTWLENYVNNGGVVLIAGIGSSTSSLTLPFGFTAYSDTINALEFNRSYGNHPIIDGVSIASLNAHVPLAYHRITGNKAGDIILARDAVNRNVRLLAASRGSGLFIISDVYAESAYVNGWNLRLLENMVTYTRKYPRLLTPANDTYLYSSVVNYTWTPINPSFGPITYTWQLSTSPTFSTLVDQQTGLVAGSGNLSVVYTMNFSSSYFYWRVRPEFGSYAAPWKLAFRLYETYNNFAPSFSQAQVSPTAGQPSSTVFNFSVVYTDKDNTAPNYMWLYINGSYWGTLTKQNTSDNNYADGCLYRYTTTISVAGTYTFYVQSSDGRYTIYTATLGFIVKTNTAPTLTSGQVSPASGPSTNSFTFTVTYTDADNDTPSYIRVVVDGSPHAMAKQNPGDTTYTDGCVYIFSDRFPVGTRYFYFTCSDGIVTATTATGNFTVTAVNNFAPMLLNPAVSPETGNTATNYNFTVEYRDADNNFPTIITISINGTVYTMQAANPADSDATDGKVYYYATTLSVVGQYVFQVNCSDGTYLANTGIINKPEVILLNTTPTLSSGQVFPLSGTPSQTFTFSVVYTDAENNNPFYVRVVVNGTQYAMLKQTPGDNTYTDGCLYIYSSTFPIGFYVFYFNCSDGLATGTTATSNFTVSIINNYAPMLLNPTVSPEIGYQTTSFNFSVVYLDSDNNLPAIITLTINGSSYIMQPTSPTDSDVTNGKGYFYITTLSDLGQYQFQVNVSDGFYLANTALINKPEVVLVNTPPTLGSGQVTPSSGTTSQIFSFSVVYTDADNNNPIYVHVVVDGVQYAMSKQNISDNTYTDGCSYGFSMNFLAGTRFYYFICSDSLDVATTAIANFNVTVVNNNAPMLLNPAVTPETGTQSTVFNFTIRYLDLDNNFPAIITITINGTLYMMQTSNAADTDARDGKDYYYATTLTSLGWYQFRVNCSDGIYAANTGLINKPQVVQGNTAPVLSSHQVIPASGTSTTNFTFSVIYTDAENDAPSYVRVIVDGDQHVMVKQNTADVTYSDGCIYVVSLVFTQGNHSFYFTCSDGLLTHTTSTGQFEVTATFIPPPTFIEQYGLLIGVLSAAVVGIAIVASVSSRKKKAKKTLAGKQLPRKTLPATTFPEKIPEKAFVGKAKGTTEVQQPMSAEALAELQKTEKEVVATMDVKACIVHKGPIKGANYSCPHCNTFYCINCAITLANNGEGCWSCGNKIELDDTIKIAGVKQPVMAEKAKFYCSSCAQYHEPEKPNFDAWESCPVCNNPMVYVKACPYCTQPIALSKEHYTLYRNKLMQCPNPDCHKNVMI